jgi:hypothetical protein
LDLCSSQAIEALRSFTQLSPKLDLVLESQLLTLHNL